MSRIYNKLVRDKIPEIIEKSGKTCTVETLADEKYIAMLDAKLNEELAEYESGNILDLTKYEDEFYSLFDSYEHPARFEYDYDTHEGRLYIYDHDGDHEADREISIAIGN